MTKELFSLEGKRIWVAGHRGMAGGAIVRRLAKENCDVLVATRQDADLRRQADIERWMKDNRPEVVFLAAGTVGGIQANSTRPAEFIYDNLEIAANVIHAANEIGVQKLVFLGSSCIYPRLAAQPMTEDALLTGPLEPTNQWYALAKIAGIRMCQAYRQQYGCDFISAMPTNLYGQGDNFDLAQGHVAAALLLKIHRAKEENAPSVEIWGTGNVQREFLCAEDLADGCIFLAKNYSDVDHVNVGTGTEVTIRELATLIARVVDYKGDFHFDSSKPDGAPRKVMDVSRMSALGWDAPTSLEDGFRQTYQWFNENQDSIRR